MEATHGSGKLSNETHSESWSSSVARDLVHFILAPSFFGGDVIKKKYSPFLIWLFSTDMQQTSFAFLVLISLAFFLLDIVEGKTLGSGMLQNSFI